MKTEIEKYRPCTEAVEFRRQHKSFKNAWNNCPRGDWMLWIAQRTGVDEKLLIKAKALCAKTVIHLMKDDHSKAAVQAALDYSDGKITKKELKNAAADDYAAYTAADAYAAAYAYVVDAKRKKQKQTADICREVLTEAILEKLESN